MDKQTTTRKEPEAMTNTIVNVDLKNYRFNSKAVYSIPEEMTRLFKIIGLERHEDYLTVATTEHSNYNLTKTILKNRLKLNICLVFSDEKDIIEAINNNYNKVI